MRLSYCSQTDMLSIQFTDAFSTESEEVAAGVVLDFDENQRVIGIELEDASQFVDLSRLELLALPLANLIFREREMVVA